MSDNIPASADQPIQSEPVERPAGASTPHEEGEFGGRSGPPREGGEFGGRSGPPREGGESGGRGGPAGPGGRRRPYYRRKVDRTRNLDITYRKPEILERFVTQSGKILPRRVTGTSAKNQRNLARQIKLARVLAMLPYKRQGKAEEPGGRGGPPREGRDFGGRGGPPREGRDFGGRGGFPHEGGEDA